MLSLNIFACVVTFILLTHPCHSTIKTKDAIYYIYPINFTVGANYLLSPTDGDPDARVRLAPRDTGTGTEQWRFVAADNVIPGTTVYRLQPIGGVKSNKDGVAANNLWLSVKVFEQDPQKNGEELTLQPLRQDNLKISHWIFEEQGIDQQTGLTRYLVRSTAFDAELTQSRESHREYWSVDTNRNGIFDLWSVHPNSYFLLQEIIPVISPKPCPKPEPMPRAEKECTSKVVWSVIATFLITAGLCMVYIKKKYGGDDARQYDHFAQGSPWQDFHFDPDSTRK